LRRIRNRPFTNTRNLQRVRRVSRTIARAQNRQTSGAVTIGTTKTTGTIGNQCTTRIRDGIEAIQIIETEARAMVTEAETERGVMIEIEAPSMAVVEDETVIGKMTGTEARGMETTEAETATGRMMDMAARSMVMKPQLVTQGIFHHHHLLLPAMLS
jgi:hypothetical protein